jgi:rhodanese-related sulfurtransferase
MDTPTIPAALSAVPSIPPAQLRRALHRADSPLLLDVRRRERFDESDRLIAGAQYCAPEDVAALARSRPAAVAVVYCVHGLEVGSEAARTLRAAGWDARFLEGGIEAPEPLPRIRKRPDLGVTGERPSRWVTRARPKIDRIACPWLVRRFIDPRAEFHYVPAAEVFEAAKRLEAVAYDLPGAPIGHEADRCSFDALIRAFDLHDTALDRLARIVRGADTGRMDLAPESAGLLAVSMGYSRLHGDDHAMLSAMLPLYDALYASQQEDGAA